MWIIVTHTDAIQKRFYIAVTVEGRPFWADAETLAYRFESKDEAEQFIGERLLDDGWTVEAVRV